MKRNWITRCALLLAALGFAAQAADLTWLTDMSKALDEARNQKKAVLINFTGSDWCGYCKKLESEVFQTKEFADYASKNLVLVKADFPRRTEQTAELKTANAALKTKYAEPFKGYPTLVLVDAAGKKLGQTVGYAPGSGPKPVMKELAGMLKK